MKHSLVCATLLVAVGATVPQKSYAGQTGTVPIIKTQSSTSSSLMKDSSTVPIIVTPSSQEVTAAPQDSPSGPQLTVQVTVNAPTTVNTPITLSTNDPSAISLPSSATVVAGSSTVTANVTVAPGSNLPPSVATIYASCNGTEVSCTVTINYPS